MKYTRILSIAVVAMFAFAAIAVTFNSDSSDADTTDYSSAAYVKLEKISQTDFETLYGSDYDELIELTDTISCLFNPYYVLVDYYTTQTITYKDVTYEASSANVLNGTTHNSYKAVKVSFTDLVVKIKFKNDVDASDYYNTNYSSDDSILDVVKYLGTDKITAGSEMTLEFATYESSSSDDETDVYTAVPNTNEYVSKEKYNSRSKLLNSTVDVSLGNKSVTINRDCKDAWNYEYIEEYADNVNFAIGTAFNESRHRTTDGEHDYITIKADGKEYKFEDYGTEHYAKDSSSLSYNEDSNSLDILSSYDYESLPTDKEYKYRSLLPSVNDNNDTAKGQIEAKGGSCNTSVDSAKNLCSDCYDDSKTSFKSDNSGSNTGLIVALVIVAVIAVILAVVLIIKISKDKTKKV